MGQASSNSNNTEAPLEGVVAPENSLRLCRRLQNYQDLVMLTYEEFVHCIKELNALSRNFIDNNGKRLVFAVKKGSDTTLLWRATVQVACVKVDSVSGAVEGVRMLSLRQFMQVFKTLQCQMELPDCPPSPRHTSEDSPSCSSCNDPPSYESLAMSEAPPPQNPRKVPLLPPITASLFLERAMVVQASSSEECCICLERKPNVTLPCAHAYCKVCIQKWWIGGEGNTTHKTCPVCREQLINTEDTWELADAPGEAEVQLEIQKTLEDLLEKVPEPVTPSSSSSDS